MDRREFMVSSVAGVAGAKLNRAMAAGRAIGSNSSQELKTLKIEDERYLIEVEAAHGTIVRLLDKVGKLELITEPRLAGNFQICLPIPGNQGYTIPDESRRFVVGNLANYIIGKDQRLSLLKQSASGLTLFWDGPLKNPKGEVFNLSAQMSIDLTGDKVQFSLTVANKTPYALSEVWYPVLGGITGLGERKETRACIQGTAGTAIMTVGESRTALTPEYREMFSDMFWNFRGTGYEEGTAFPEILLVTPLPPPTPVPFYPGYFTNPAAITAPWIDIYNRKLNRGLYFGLHDSGSKQKIMRIILQPGIGHMRLDTWPRPEEVDANVPVGLVFSWLYAISDGKPGEGFAGKPVVLQFHEGDGRQGATIYDQWLKTQTSGREAEKVPPPENKKAAPAGAVADHLKTSLLTANFKPRRNVLKLENEHCLVEVDEQSGVIRRIRDKAGRLDLITDPRLAGSFELSLLSPTLDAAHIVGQSQALTSTDLQQNKLTLTWKGPLLDTKGFGYYIDASMSIALIGSTIEFRTVVENRSPFQVAEVWYPVVGGFSGIGSRTDTRWSLAPEYIFQSPAGPPAGQADGVSALVYQYEQAGLRGMPWIDLYNTKLNRALYFASHDPLGRAKSFRFEKRPGLGASGDQHLAESPIGRFHCICYPYLKPNERFESPPVTLQFHEGGWPQGAKLYRQWFTSQFKIADPRKDSFRQEMAIQSAHFMQGEGDVYFKYRDIAKWARAAHEFGVDAVLPIAWSLGGHEADYPAYEPEPRLGTWKDLEEGIRACHQMGVKIFLFANTQPINVETQWFKCELHQYLMRDLRGSAGMPWGYGMGTVAGRAGLVYRRCLDASVGIPRYQEILVSQFRRLAEIGADGLHVDQFWPFRLDFNPLLKASPDRSFTEGQLEVMDRLLKACREVNPEFSVSMESHLWDRPLQYGLVAWTWPNHWSPDAHGENLMRYTFPEWISNYAVLQPYDYNIVNNAVRYGFCLNIGPGKFVSFMGDAVYRPLCTYIREVQRIRKALKDTIWLGEYLDTLEATVEGPADTRYSVYRNPRSGKRAAVVVNFAAAPREITIRSFSGNPGGTVRLYQPFKEEASARLPLTLNLPAERFAIVVEEQTYGLSIPSSGIDTKSSEL